jgi:Glycosyltransferase family 87
MKHKSDLNVLGLLLAVAVAVICYGAIWGCFKPQVFSGVKADFSCFYRAGRMVVSGDAARVYDLHAERQYDSQLHTSFVDAAGHSFSLPFVFAPFVLLLFAPLSLLPYSQAEPVWYGMNVGMLLAVPFVLRRKLGWGTRGVVIAILAPLSFVPVTMALMQGQPTILVLLIFALTFAALSAGNEVRAGTLLALATFKPQLVIPALLALVAMRKWKALAAFASAGVVLVGISIGIAGWHATVNYPHAILEFSRLSESIGGEHPENMPNVRGVVHRLFDSRISNAMQQSITLAITAALLTGMVLKLRRSRQFFQISYSLVLAVTLLVSYHAYLHDFALLLLPCILTADYLSQTGWTIQHAALGGDDGRLLCHPSSTELDEDHSNPNVRCGSSLRSAVVHRTKHDFQRGSALGFS